MGWSQRQPGLEGPGRRFLETEFKEPCRHGTAQRIVSIAGRQTGSVHQEEGLAHVAEKGKDKLSIRSHFRDFDLGNATNKSSAIGNLIVIPVILIVGIILVIFNK